MIDSNAITPTAKVYLKPVGFLDSPQHFDDRHRRLANCLLWFSALECWFVQASGVVRALVPTNEIDTMLAGLPDPVAQRAALLMARLTCARAELRCGERVLRFDQPHVMGILNITPDSFSDGGRFTSTGSVDVEAAVASGAAMAEAGASIIDIGGESTRPGAEPVWEGDEINRVVPVIERLKHIGTVLSVDTRKAAVMSAALAAGAQIINDVAALGHDERALAVAAAAQVPVVLMHAPSQGEDPHAGSSYHNIVTDCFDWLEARINAVVAAGIDRHRIIADPGLGFGKSMSDNAALINNIALFHGLGVPLLIGASRKRFIGAFAKEAPVDRRLGGSVMVATHAVQQGAQIVRVHDVPESVQAVQIWRGLRDAGVTARA